MASARRASGARWVTSRCARKASTAPSRWRSKSGAISAPRRRIRPGRTERPSGTHKEEPMLALARLALPLTLLATVAALPVHAERQTRPVAGFTAIALSAPLKLELVQGDTEGLALEGAEATRAGTRPGVGKGRRELRTAP